MSVDMLSMIPPDLFPFFDAPSVAYPQVGNAALPVAALDVQRVLIGFMIGQTSGTTNFSTDSAVSVTKPGYALTSTSTPMILTYWQHGPLVMQPWFGQNNGGTFTVGIQTMRLRTGISLADSPLAKLTAQLPPNPDRKLSGPLRDYWNWILRKQLP